MVERIPNYLDGKTFSKLVNIAVASSKINLLKLPHTTIRPYFHIILKGFSGVTKSTILFEICEKEKQTSVMSLTKATFLGAVDKTTGVFMPPVTWDSRNSILAIDEYSFKSKDPKDKELLGTLLQVMENPSYVKPIGYRCNDFEEKDKDLYCIVKDNKIRVRTRFSLLMTTMFSLSKSQSVLVEALVNRCLVIPFYPTLDDMKRRARGENYYIHKKIDVRKKVEIKKSDYNKILKYVDSSEVDVKQYLRTVGDLCRAFAVLHKHIKEVYRLIIALRMRD